MSGKYQAILQASVLLLLAAPLSAQGRDTLPSKTARPIQVTDSAVARGRSLFHGSGNCSACHGPEGIGTDSGAPLAQGVWLHGDDTYEAILSRVVHGIPKSVSTRGTEMPMRGWSTLDNDQVRDVAAYVWWISHGWMRRPRKP